MARIRTIKPEFYRNEALQDLEAGNPGMHIMLVFSALWGHCDKAGNFPWKPRVLKLDILPFLDFDLSASLVLLWEHGLVERYEIGGNEYGHIATFTQHQRISGKEAQDPPKYPSHNNNFTDRSQGSAGEAPETAGREGKGRELSKSSEAKASGTRSAPGESLEVKLYRVGKEVLGKSAGGVVTKVRRFARGDDAEALRLIEVAGEKQDPSEWINAVLKGDESRPMSMDEICPPEIYDGLQ